MKVNFGDFAPFIREAGDRVLLRVKSVENDERGNTADFTLENERGEIIKNKFDFDNEGAVRGYYVFSKNLNKGIAPVAETSQLVGMTALFDLVEAERRGVDKDGNEIIYINIKYSYVADREFVSQVDGADTAPVTDGPSW